MTAAKGMNRICIAVSADNPAAIVGAMAQSFGHPQPNGAATRITDRIAGAQTRVQTIGEVASPESDSGVTVFLDGDIFDDAGPIERPERLIAEHYRKGELDRLAWLNGSFSTIVADHRTETVVLATDRIGTRCLFAWIGNGGMSAANQLSTLLADIRIPRRMSLQGIVELLSFQRTMGTQTQYADVVALPGAAVWTYRGGRCERRTTRSMIWTGAARDKRETAYQVADALRAAARRRMVGPGRPGLLLSGGLDARTVLAAAVANGGSIDCVSVIARDNQETRTARAIAESVDANFQLLTADPAMLSSALDASVEASHGLFAAPINLYGSVGKLSAEYDMLFSGHGLDYTLRGYYLPCRRVNIANGRMRLPMLSPVDQASPDNIANGQRVGIPAGLARTILRPGFAAEWADRRAAAVAGAMANAEFARPQDAWDSLILHAQGRHYAHSDFVAMEGQVPHRTLAFDADLLDLYFSMPTAWRAGEWVARKALAILSPTLARVPDANTGFAAKIPFPAQLSLMLARALLRRLHLLPRATGGRKVETDRSWADLAELMRLDPEMRRRVEALPHSAILLDSGLFERSEMENVVAAHMARQADNRKLLHQLLSIESWFVRHPYTDVHHS